MRDIRKDLEERLESVASERARLQDELQKLAEREGVLKALISEEAARWGGEQFPLTPSDGVLSGTPLSRFIVGVLSDGMVRTTDDMVRLALERSIPFSAKSPKRSMNLALVNMKRKGVLDMVESGSWRIAEEK